MFITRMPINAHESSKKTFMSIRDHLWPFVYDNEVMSLFSIQDEIDDVVDVANVDLAIMVGVGGAGL